MGNVATRPVKRGFDFLVNAYTKTGDPEGALRAFSFVLTMLLWLGPDHADGVYENIGRIAFQLEEEGYV
jgi:hypothetical protein